MNKWKKIYGIMGVILLLLAVGVASKGVWALAVADIGAAIFLLCLMKYGE